MTIVVAHRGADAKHENTLLAIKKAFDNNLRWVEVDVRVTKDKVPVIMHDDKVDRTTNSKGFVKELTLEQIKTLRIGREKVPTLEEVLDFAKGKVNVLIELKTADSMRPVCRLVKQKKMKKHVIIMSFAHKLVKYSKIFARTKTAVPIVEIPVRPMRILRESKANVLMVYYETLLGADFVFRKLAKKIHKKKKKLFVYTVDMNTVFNRSHIQKFIEIGVDGIVANEAAKTKKIVEAMEKWTAFSAK
jgi:glycerophosphoryl diester phosphodiesterase